MATIRQVNGVSGDFIFALIIPTGWGLDGVKELPMTSEDVNDAVGSRGGQQRSLRVPRKYYGSLAVVPSVNNKERIHDL